MAMCGRPADATATEDQLMADAAFTFALAGKNRELALRLGQRLRPPAITTEDLAKLGLPNPTLALAKSNGEQLRRNLQFVHQKISLAEHQDERRLVCAIDHTYLTRQLCQTKIGGKAGLVGIGWLPHGDEECFYDFDAMPKSAAKAPAAPLMLECLVWSPVEKQQRCFSIASMPMALKSNLPSSECRTRNTGKWVACSMFT